LIIKEFEWDEGNIVHIEMRHGVTPDEAEEVFAVRPLYSKTREGKYIAFGPTQDGRYLAVVFEKKPKGLARVITGRDMEAKERKLWKKHKQK